MFGKKWVILVDSWSVRTRSWRIEENPKVNGQDCARTQYRLKEELKVYSLESAFRLIIEIGYNPTESKAC